MVHWISLKLCTYTAAIQWPKSKLCLGWNSTLWPFFCNTQMLFSFYYLLPDILCNILLHSFHISTNFKVYPFQMVPRICISLLQGLSYRHLDLGMSFRRTLEEEKKIGCFCAIIFEMQEKGHIVLIQPRYNLDIGHQMAAVYRQRFRLIQ